MHALRLRARFALLLARRTVHAFIADSGTSWSAATAFYLVLSVPPRLIAFTSSAVGIAGAQAARTFVTQQVGQFLPAGSSQLKSVVDSTIVGFGPAAAISIGFLLVSGTRVFEALARAINVFWSHVDDAGWLRRQVSRGLLLVVVGGLFSLSVGLEVATAVVGRGLHLPPIADWLLRSQLLPALLVFAGLLATYRLLPHNAASWRTAATGALTGTLLLRLAQAFFTLFLATFGNFRSAYGPLASIAILMSWALIASGAVLLAAELVAVLDRRRIPGRKRP
ncbi:MAG TPA: YihY/virulence factor BrkB family protein [Candidatus Limnocylindrales bacterium]|nr:YihY/virulence factor BrkB family protein [Candidatus Limnocylindrales bacterium]